MRDWVEYLNFDGDSTQALRRAANGRPEPFRVRYWGVGNENWGCGGHMQPEEYGREYRRFSTYVRDFPGAPLFLIGCGPTANDPDWTRRFFTAMGGYRRIHGWGAHYYCGTAGTATEYTDDQWYELLEKATADGAARRSAAGGAGWLRPGAPHRADRGRVGHLAPSDPRPQPRLPVAAGTRCATASWRRFPSTSSTAMPTSCGWPTSPRRSNVLQALILTDGDKTIVTPTGHVYGMYADHQGAESLRTQVEAEEVSFHGG